MELYMGDQVPTDGMLVGRSGLQMVIVGEFCSKNSTIATCKMTVPANIPVVEKTMRDVAFFSFKSSQLQQNPQPMFSCLCMPRPHITIYMKSHASIEARAPAFSQQILASHDYLLYS